MLSLFVRNHNSPNIPTLLIGSFSFADLGHCCRPGGPVCEGGAAALGPEDDPQVPRSQRAGLHPVMAGWARLQCHHPQKQVNLFLKKAKCCDEGVLLSASRRLPQKLLSRKWPIQRPPNLSHYLPLLLNVTITPKLGRVTISNLSLRPPGNLVRCCSFLDAPGFKLAALAMCCRLVLIPYFGVGAAFDAKFWCWGYFWCHILVLLALLMPYFGVTGSLDPIFCPLIANCQT